MIYLPKPALLSDPLSLEGLGPEAFKPCVALGFCLSFGHVYSLLRKSLLHLCQGSLLGLGDCPLGNTATKLLGSQGPS